MSRSKWKGPYIKINFLKNLKKNNKNSHTISKNSEITAKFLGSSFKVYNGKIFTELTINDSMLGRKFGEFIFTREKFFFKKKKK